MRALILKNGESAHIHNNALKKMRTYCTATIIFMKLTGECADWMAMKANMFPGNSTHCQSAAIYISLPSLCVCVCDNDGFSYQCRINWLLKIQLNEHYSLSCSPACFMWLSAISSAIICIVSSCIRVAIGGAFNFSCRMRKRAIQNWARLIP